MKTIRTVLLLSLCGLAAAAAAQGYPARPIALVVAFSAGGPIGVGRVAKGAPDGYLLGIGHIGTHVVNGAICQLGYGLQTDLEPVAMIATNPQILVSRNPIPAKDLKEFLAWEKANQGKASVGTGGAAPAMQDLLSGQIDFMFDQAASSLP